MIGFPHFGPYHRKQIFREYRICAGIQQITQTFIREQIQKKIVTKFFQ